MIQVIPDSSVFIQIINFLLLIFLLNLVLYKPIRQILLKRKEKINSLEASIETADQDAVDKEASFKDGIKEARMRGLKEKEALVHEATEKEKEIVEQINQKAQADLAEIRDKIAKETDDVRATLEKEIDSFADAIGQKILGRAV